MVGVRQPPGGRHFVGHRQLGPRERTDIFVFRRFPQEANIDHRFNELRLSMFRVGPRKFPALKGKAAEIRGFAGVLKSVFEDLMDEGNKQHRQVRLALVQAVTMERILDENPDSYCLPAPAASLYHKSAFALVQLETALSNFYHPQGDMLFHFTIKSHYLCHLGIAAKHMNPRLAWCYSGEDLMMKIKSVVQASYSGTPAHALAPKVMQKYAFGLGLGMLDSPWRA